MLTILSNVVPLRPFPIAVCRYINVGSTVGAVNFPEVDLRTPDPKARTVRILNIHENVPGVLKVWCPWITTERS